MGNKYTKRYTEEFKRGAIALVARLVHNAEPGGDFDRYYEDAGFGTVDNRP
ncbi:hypothetical protein ACPCAE_33700 [Streptomyces cinereoruber]|uniref:hypothetical protein n=1 Tax=Streptomyces cinereoruber TaxID=67260 RepID=UPI003C2E0DDB